MVKASLPAYADVTGQYVPGRPQHPAWGHVGHLSLKQRTWIWTGAGLARGFSRAVQVAAGLQGCAGMRFEGKTWGLLKSRGFSLLVICVVYCYAHGEFKTLGGKFLC